MGTGGGSDTQVKVGPVGTGEVTATLLSDTVCSQVLWATVDPTEAQGTDDFLDLRDHSGSTTEGNEDNYLMPAVTMVVSGLACTVDVAPGAGDEWAMTIRRGTPGALGDTAVTCTIADTDTTCSDTTNSEATALTDALTISIDGSGGASDPTAAGDMDCRMCLSN
jgi:hypothetical protein